MTTYLDLLNAIKTQSSPEAWARFDAALRRNPQLISSLNAASQMGDLQVIFGDPGPGKGAVFKLADPIAGPSINQIILRGEFFEGNSKDYVELADKRNLSSRWNNNFVEFSHEFLGHYATRAQYADAVNLARDNASGVDAETRAANFTRAALYLEGDAWLKSYRAYE
jgi:hypothetical protein